MSDQTFQTRKDTGTYGDVFTAAGLAALIQDGMDEGSVRILENASGFSVFAPADWDITGLHQHPGYPYLQVKSEAIPSSVSQMVSYQAEKKRVEIYNDARKQIRASAQAAQDPALQAMQNDNQPREDWRLLQVLNTLQGFKNTNRAHELIVTTELDRFQEQIRTALEALSSGHPSGIDWKTSSVQLFNPNSAKGYGLLKPSGTDRNSKTKEQWTDSFVEWLRYRGYFVAACPFFMGSRGESIRILAPVPSDISFAAFRDVCSALRRLPIFGSPPKVDSRAVLGLARILIDHSEFGEALGSDVPEELRLILGDSTPARLISGVAVTHFQSLGQARAVSQLATLALPAWFRINSAEDAAAWRSILDEHGRILRALRDDHSDEVGFVIAYRRFLEKRGPDALDRLLDLMGTYGAYLPGARERRRLLPSFTTRNFRRLVEGRMGEYVAILDDPGFQAVAGAIRRATVSAQTLKSQKQDHREIRYDLLHEIRRKRTLTTDSPLIELLSDFIASYNYENARRREMGKRVSRNVTTDELMSLVTLIEQHRAPLVGAMLAAYGSCRMPRDPESTPPPGADEPPEDEAPVEGVVAEDEEE